MTTFLVIIAVVLAILAITQLARVFDLSANLSKDTEEIKESSSKANALLLRIWGIGFFASFVYLMYYYGDPMPVAASVHGAKVDALMLYNMYLILTVFVVVNFFLFYFASKYYYKKDRKATFYAHDNKLELIWTIVPTIVLAFIIIFGLITWFEITDQKADETITVEITSEQYNWTVRYAGDNGHFGAQSYNLIGVENETGNPNSLGLATEFVIESKLDALDKTIADLEEKINTESHLMTADVIESVEDDIYQHQRHKKRILDLDNYKVGDLNAWDAGKDDKVAKELHLVVDKEVEFTFRSKDVIHSAYMPHFRAQMNTVPGMTTRFKMIPSITTKTMRLSEGQDFDYVLLCNKICGGSHYNMKIAIIVETQEEYDAWLAEQGTFVTADETTAEVKKEDNVIVENEDKVIAEN